MIYKLSDTDSQYFFKEEFKFVFGYFELRIDRDGRIDLLLKIKRKLRINE